MRSVMKLLGAVALVVTWTSAPAQPIAPDNTAAAPARKAGKRGDAELISAATSSGFYVDTANREEVRLFFQAIYPASEGASMGWTGNYSSTDPLVAAGNTSADFKDAVALRVNFFRALAGVPAVVTFDSTFNAKAQLAAMMMSVNNSITHTPPSNWDLYTADGAEAASSSNLALGVAGASSIDGYIADPGAGNDAVGHRRWVLYPQTTGMGTGDVPGNGTLPATNALWVFDSNYGGTRPFVRESFVAWPAPGHVPYQVVYPRWSLSYPGADFSSATVSMTRGGAAVPVNLETVKSGYGENTLVWVPDNQDTSSSQAHARPESDVTYDVSVSNVVVDGQAQAFNYAVIVFDPATEGADTEAVAITGTASPVVGEATTYSVGGLYYATGYQWRTLSTTPYSAVEGAENGESGLVITSTGSYNVITTSAHASGSAAFHLAHATTDTQLVELDRTFLGSAGAQISFQSRLGYASGSQVARVEVSLDEGASWVEVFAQAGTGGAGEAVFSLKQVSLSSLDGLTFRVRFAYTFSTGSYFPGTGSGVGWYFDDVTLSGVELADAQAASATQTGNQFAFTPSSAGSYKLQARGVFYDVYPLSWGPVKSVTAETATPTAPSFSLHPASQTVAPGANVTLTAAATGVPSPQFQWYKDGVAIAGATGTSISLLGVDESRTGSYTVVATNSVGSATSTAAALTVAAVPTAPFITSPPTSVTTVEGQPLTLNVSANGYPALSYQWTRNGVAIDGATAASFSVASAATDDSGEYRVTAVNSEGGVTSPAAIVSVYSSVAITSQPAGQSIGAGDSATLSVAATGSGLTYQWYAGAAGDVSAPIAGATSASFTTPPLDVSARFWVRVSSPAQTVNSSAAIVVVTSPARYFFGAIGGSGDGLFGLVLRPDNTATFVGCILSSGTLIEAQGIAVSSGGTFSFDGGLVAGTVAGEITSQSVAGTMSGPSLAFAGTEVTVEGVTAALAGAIEAVQANTSDDAVIVLVGPDQSALVLSSQNGAWTAAMLPVTAGGSIEGTLPDGQIVALQISALTGRISGSMTQGDVQRRISGARAGFQMAQRIENLSVRALVRQGQNIMITGFVVAGAGSKHVVVRGVGPSLADFGVGDTVADPIVRIYRSSDPDGSPPIAENDDWGSADNAGSMVAAASAVGAFDLEGDSADAGLYLSLPPGGYTAHVSGKNGGTGAAIVEIYDADAALGLPSTARLANISMRGEAGSGSSLVIAGFVVSGSTPKRLLIRGIGPELGAYGVSGTLSDPVLRLYQGNDELAVNDDWDEAGQADDVVQASSTVGAFPLTAGSGSAAFIIWLEPGLYTAQLGSADTSSGVAIVEVYEMP